MKQQLTLLFLISIFSPYIMAEIVLESNQDTNISIEQDTWQYFEITATQDNMNISIELSNLSSDIDLYIQKGSLPTQSNYSDRGIQQNTRTEHLTPILNDGETLFIGIYGYTQATALLKAQYIKEASNILPSFSLKNYSIKQGEWKYYQIVSNIDNTDVTIKLPSMSDDVDLYISTYTYPTLDIYNARSIQQSTRAEELNTVLASGEKLYIGIYGYHQAEGTIQANYEDLSKAIDIGKRACFENVFFTSYCSLHETNIAYVEHKSTLYKVNVTPNKERIEASLPLGLGAHQYILPIVNTPLYHLNTRKNSVKKFRCYHGLKEIDALTYTFPVPNGSFKHLFQTEASADGLTLTVRFSAAYAVGQDPIPPLDRSDIYNISDLNNIVLINSIRP